MDQRGQISVEFILLAAIVLMVVVSIGVVVANENELNSVASAVRIGAENGTTHASIVNPNMQPVRVTSVDMDGRDNITIQVHFSSSVNPIKDPIFQSISNSLTGSGYTTSYSGGESLNLVTSRHNYTITLA